MTASEFPLSPDPAVEWNGGKRRYDLVKEAIVALAAVAALTVLLAAIFSSPDDRPVTLAQWAIAAPNDFLATAASELDGTSGVATYGPPYTHVPEPARTSSAISRSNASSAFASRSRPRERSCSNPWRYPLRPISASP